MCQPGKDYDQNGSRAREPAPSHITQALDSANSRSSVDRNSAP